MKKFTSILLAVAMLAAMTVIMIPTVSAAWDGSSVSAALVGSGTEYDPYLISSENDLAYVAKEHHPMLTPFAHRVCAPCEVGTIADVIKDLER